MSKHTNIFGISKVRRSWIRAFESCHEGDNFSQVKAIVSEPDELWNLGDSMLYTYIAEEFKGCLRGGTIVRKMQFVVKEGKVISKAGQNLYSLAA